MNIPLLRLLNQQIISSRCSKPEEVVSRMGAMQAQDLRSALWAVGLRMKRPCRRAVVDALRTGRIIRIHVMRPTWHFVAPDDLRPLIALNRNKIERVYAGYCREQGLNIGEDDYSRCLDALREALQGGRELTLDALRPAVEKSGLPADERYMRAYLWRAESRAVVCGGMPQNGRLTYTLIDERVPPTPDISREETMTLLAAKYLRSHAPATLHDFVWWSALSPAEAMRAIERLGSDVEKTDFNGRTVFIHRDCRRHGKAAGTACLLPPYDEYLLGYKDRTDVLPETLAHIAHNNRGIFRRVTLQDGQVTGNWSEHLTAEGTRISTTHRRDELAADSRAIEKAAAKYIAYLDDSRITT